MNWRISRRNPADPDAEGPAPAFAMELVQEDALDVPAVLDVAIPAVAPVLAIAPRTVSLHAAVAVGNALGAVRIALPDVPDVLAVRDVIHPVRLDAVLVADRVLDPAEAVAPDVLAVPDPAVEDALVPAEVMDVAPDAVDAAEDAVEADAVPGVWQPVREAVVRVPDAPGSAMDPARQTAMWPAGRPA